MWQRLADYTNMHTMREQLMVRMRPVFIYHYRVSFFVKGRCQVTYSSFTVITYFLNPIKKEENHPFKIYDVNFLFLRMLDYK